MKKLFFACIGILGFAAVADAQAPVQIARAVFSVPSIQTEAQFTSIQQSMMQIPGVTFTNVNYHSHQLVFAYNPQQVTSAQISAALLQNGYANQLALTTESGTLVEYNITD